MTDLVYYDTIWNDALYLRAPKSWQIASLIFRTEPNEKKSNEETRNKNRGTQKKRSVIKSVESVLGPEGSLWLERLWKRSWAGSEREMELWWWEWWVDIVRKCCRSMNRQVRDRGTGIKLTERTGKLIPDTWRRIPKGAISYRPSTRPKSKV